MSHFKDPIDRKWRLDVYGKVTSVVLGALIIWLGTYVWGVVGDAAAATTTIYREVPRHDRVLYGPSPRPRVSEDYPGLIREVEALKAQAMPPGLASRLDKFLAVQEKKAK